MPSQFEGIAIGGPADGRRQACQGRLLRLSMPLPMDDPPLRADASTPPPEALSSKVEYYHYVEWHETGKQFSAWRHEDTFPTDLDLIVHLVNCHFAPKKEERMRSLLETALNALKSYQFGNSSRDLAEEVANEIERFFRR